MGSGFVQLIADTYLIIWFLTFFSLLFRFYKKPKTVWSYYFNLLLALDQFVNALLFGDPDETLSGRLGRAQLAKKKLFFVKPFRKFVDWLFIALIGQRNHCIESIEHEETFDKEIWSWIKEK